VHLGDQVYGQKELVDSFVILRQAHQNGDLPSRLASVSNRVQNRLADIYRFTWNLPDTAECLAHASHLMIWSDNDLYNDFTIAREGNKPLSNAMLHYGQLTYRAYQRQLWDPNYEDHPTPTSDEFYFQKYHNVGILMIDMRGNRIDWNGNTHLDNPFINDRQWSLIRSSFADPDVMVMLVCSEIPFVSDPPAVARKRAGEPGTEFIKDHWAYNSEEVIKLFELAFEWKAKVAGRELLFAAGDIHVGVQSEIFDSVTKTSAKHLTATPICNNVAKYYPALEGRLNERFTFKHRPLEKRNYGLIDINFDSKGLPHVNARLVPDPQ